MWLVLTPRGVQSRNQECTQALMQARLQAVSIGSPVEEQVGFVEDVKVLGSLRSTQPLQRGHYWAPHSIHASVSAQGGS